MNKRLAIVNHNLGSGGAEKLIYDMALELKERNIEFSIILLTNVNDIYGKKLQNNGVEVIYLSNKWDIYSPKNILRLKKILKNYDIIHSHTYAAQLWVAFASLLLNRNKKYITTEHSTTNNRREKWYFRYLDRWMYSRYGNIVSITQEVQEKLQNWIKKDLKYTIIKNGIDIEKYMKAIPKKRSEFNLRNEDKLICQVARFTELKMQETTVKMLKLLPIDYKVIFLGEGRTEKKIKELAKSYKLEDRIRFLGYQSDVAEIIKMCDISILTSKYEGLPISAIESMAINPFIGSDVIGIKELVKDFGEIFEYQNPDDLASKILKIMENKNYKKTKEKCLKRAMQFDIKDTVKKYIELFREEE